MKATLLVMAAAGLAGCGQDFVPTAPDAPRVAVVSSPGARALVVMTRNVYPGTRIEDAMAVPVEQVPLVVAQSWAELQLTNFPERAGALAAEIAANGPHVVGLPELPIYRVQIPGDLIMGGMTPATTVAADFLQILVDSLTARGLHYVVAVEYRTIDAEVPAFAGFDEGGNPTFMDVRYTDGDAILVRQDVATANAAHGIYEAYIPFSMGGVPLPIVRGWGAVDVTLGATTYRVVNTHLEDMVTEVQVGQAMELLGMLAAETKPLVLTGDFNSDALTNSTPTYGMVRQAGFVDVWAQAHPREVGLTCCNPEELVNTATSGFTKRVDFVFLGGPWVREGRFVGGLQAGLVGDQPTDRTASGLWPSDHGGVVARIETPAAPTPQ